MWTDGCDTAGARNDVCARVSVSDCGLDAECNTRTRVRHEGGGCGHEEGRGDVVIECI